MIHDAISDLWFDLFVITFLHFPLGKNRLGIHKTKLKPFKFRTYGEEPGFFYHTLIEGNNHTISNSLHCGNLDQLSKTIKEIQNL